MKKMMSKCPKLGDIMNKEGHKPLTYWILGLGSKLDINIAKSILNPIAEKTDMSEWKESKLLDELNEKKIKNRLNRTEGYKPSERRSYRRKKVTKKKYRSMLEKDRKTYIEELKQYESSISPVEVAIACNNEYWLKEALLNWRLSGNVFTKEGEHILARALRTCSYEMIHLLFKNGGLKRYVPNTSFDMDGLIIEVYFWCYKDYANKKNEKSFSKTNLSLLIEYHEYLERSVFSNEKLAERTYKANLLKRITDKKSKGNKRIPILNKATKLYFELTRTKEGKIEDCMYIRSQYMFLPYIKSKKYLSVAAGIPECIELVLTILYFMQSIQ